MSLVISNDVYARIAEHLQRAYPNEGAGLLLGHAEGVSPTIEKNATAVLPFANKSDASEAYHRYLITARDMLAGEAEAERLGLEVIGIFHSHPDDTARGSEYDREFALPWYSYLIVSVQKRRATGARSWVLSDDRSRFLEEELIIKSNSI